MIVSLNKKQTLFWEALFNDDLTIRNNAYSEFASWGGYGSGKTMVVLHAINLICSRYPNVNCVVIRETYSQLDDTIIADFNKMFGHRGYSHKVGRKEVVYPNGSIIRFRAFDKPEKILGGNIDIIVISQAEQIQKDLFKQLFGRQRGKTTLPKKLIITEGNPSECWAKYRYYDVKELPKHIFYVHSTTYDNREFLDEFSPDYIPTLEKNLTESEIKKQMLGDWNSHEEMVFTSFNQEINIIEPFTIPDTYRKAVGGDYGYRTPSAFVYACRDYDGNIIIFDEFYEKEQSIRQLRDASWRYGKLPVAFDFATKRPDRDGKSVWTELSQEGCLLIECNKDEARNISVVNTLFKTGRLFITRNCVNLISEIKGYKWKRVRLGSELNLPEKTVDKDNHAIDALLYVVAYIEDVKSKDPNKIPIENTVKFNILNTKKEESWIRYG